jgi:hypothetical protein
MRKNRSSPLLLLLLLIEESDDPGVEVVDSAEKPQFVVDPEVWRTFKEISITRTPYIK